MATFNTEMELALRSMDTNPDYIAKIALDSNGKEEIIPKGKKRQRPVAWERKRKFKKTMYHRFFSEQPSMDLSKIDKGGCTQCGIHDFSHDDDYRRDYPFNIYTRVYFSRTGAIRKFSGDILHDNHLYIVLKSKKHISKLLNKRMRRLEISDEDRAWKWADYHKLLNPDIHPRDEF